MAVQRAGRLHAGCRDEILQRARARGEHTRDRCIRDARLPRHLTDVGDLVADAHAARHESASRQPRVRVHVVAGVHVADIAEVARLLHEKEGRGGEERRTQIHEAADLVAAAVRESSVGGRRHTV